MRVLHVNKFLFRKGGAESYMLDVAAEQRRRGADVAFFGMQHPQNPALPYSEFFPEFLRTDPPPERRRDQFVSAGRLIWNGAARTGVARVVDAYGPDVVHLHNIYHQLSPSILAPLRARAIPTVMTLHDYKLACPSYRFFDGENVCQACVSGGFRQAARRRCKDGSLASSALLALESAVHQRLGAYDGVDLFLCPSVFLRDQMVAAGVSPNRLRHLPHFARDVDRPGPVDGQPRVLFAGRLSREKGADVFVTAACRSRAAARFVVAGDGPARGGLTEMAEALAPGRVTFMGHLADDALAAQLAAATAVVVPSRWYENQPMIVLEAFAAGVPVVASALGGIPELVSDGVDGLLIPPDDPEALSRALDELLTDPARARAMGLAGRRKVLRDFSLSAHLAGLAALYESAAALPSRGAE